MVAGGLVPERCSQLLSLRILASLQTAVGSGLCLPPGLLSSLRRREPAMGGGLS